VTRDETPQCVTEIDMLQKEKNPWDFQGLGERAKGLEPSTFTLARRLNPNDINSLAREYGYLAVTGRYLDIQPVTPEWCAKWCASRDGWVAWMTLQNGAQSRQSPARKMWQKQRHPGGNITCRG
jgi:hypothetical protein